MGPYGVDRAVHSMEFIDCENGLGKSIIIPVFICFIPLLYFGICHTKTTVECSLS